MSSPSRRLSSGSVTRVDVRVDSGVSLLALFHFSSAQSSPGVVVDYVLANRPWTVSPEMTGSPAPPAYRLPIIWLSGSGRIPIGAPVTSLPALLAFAASNVRALFKVVFNVLSPPIRVLIHFPT